MGMESVPKWAQDENVRFLYNDDQIAHAGEILRWLFARCGTRTGKKLHVRPVREITNFVLSQDIRVYGAIYDSCIRHGETDAWNGFTEVFPDWNPWHPPTLDELFYAGKGFKTTTAQTEEQHPVFSPLHVPSFIRGGG